MDNTLNFNFFYTVAFVGFYTVNVFLPKITNDRQAHVYFTILLWVPEHILGLSVKSIFWI